MSPFSSPPTSKICGSNPPIAQWDHAPQTIDGRPLSAVFGDEVNVPVFWGCGVTPQEAVMKAALEGTYHGPLSWRNACDGLREDDVL
jgi:hypothetical protein